MEEEEEAHGRNEYQKRAEEEQGEGMEGKRDRTTLLQRGRIWRAEEQKRRKRKGEKMRKILSDTPEGALEPFPKGTNTYVLRTIKISS